MLYKALLVLLPAAAYAQISLRIQVGLFNPIRPFGRRNNLNSIQVDGSEVDIISDTEQQTWQISDVEQLKDAALSILGKRPVNVFLARKPPFLGLFEERNWQEVHRTFQIVSVSVENLRYELVDLATERLMNYGTVPATYNAGIRQSVEETVSTTWSTQGHLSVSQPITHSIVIGAGDAKPASIYFTGKWGENTNTSKTFTIGTESESPVRLLPGESVVYTLKAYRGTMEIQVRYKADLKGTVACHVLKPYPTYNSFRLNQFWPIDIKSLLHKLNKPLNMYATETIKIGFYANPILW